MKKYFVIDEDGDNDAEIFPNQNRDVFNLLEHMGLIHVIEDPTQVIWVSRHEPSEEQVSDLRRIYGDSTAIEQISANLEITQGLLCVGGDDARLLFDSEKYKDHVLVLVGTPEHYEAALKTAPLIPVLKPVMKRTILEDGSVVMEHDYFLEYKKIEIIAEKL